MKKNQQRQPSSSDLEKKDLQRDTEPLHLPSADYEQAAPWEDEDLSVLEPLNADGDVPLAEAEFIPVELNLASPEVRRAKGETLFEPRAKSRPGLKPKVILVSLVLVTLLAITISVLYNLNLQERVASPMTLKDQSISNAEFSFVYHYVLLESGLDIYREGSEELLAGPGQNDFATLREYFIDMTAREIQITQLLYDDAIAKGYKIEDSHREMTQAYLDWLSKKAAELGVDRKTYIRGYFGEFVTEELLTELLTKRYFTEAYSEGPKLEELRASDQQAEEAYASNPYQYDLVSYRILRIVFEQTDQSFIDTAQLRAQQIIDGINHDESKFESVAASFFTGEAKERLSVPNTTLVSNVRYAGITDKEWQSWLFSQDRKPGDSVIFNDENGFPIILCFSSRARQSESLRDVRLFYLNREDTEKGVKGISANDILPMAQGIYDEIKDEASLQKLETAYADEIKDEKIKAVHKTDAYPGMFGQAVDQWVFDAARKPGDKTIIETESQVVVVYYVNKSQNPEWFDRVNSFIRMNNYQAFLLEKGTEYPYTLIPEGITYIKDVPGK